MASRSARARAMRTAVAVAAVAAPLAAAGSAQAAVAGAAPSTTTSLPDLVSATATGASTIQVCYDKALDATNVAPTSFSVINYLSGTNLAGESNALGAQTSVIDPGNNKCVDLTFAPQGGQLDLGAGTVLSDNAGAVTTSGQGNLADSITVSSSVSATGTAGHTAGPDLTSVRVGTSSPTPSASNPNTLIYTFDQNVDPTAANLNATEFQFQYAPSAGATNFAVGSTIASVSGNTVTVQFNATSVANATIAYVLPGAVYSAESGASANEVPNGTGSYGVNGIAAVPTLTATGATLNAAAQSTPAAPAYGSVTYTFDQPLTAAQAGAVVPGDFGVNLADGNTLTGTATNATAGSSSVTVSFANLPNVAEYAVRAYVTGGALGGTAPTPGPVNVFTAGASGGNTPSSAPIGGNAGLNARGYTTGPDVQAVVPEGNDTAGGPQYLVYLDQRINAAASVPASITLLGSSGTSVGAGTPALTYNPSNGIGQNTVLVAFPTGSTFFSSGASQIQFAAGAFKTYLSNSSTGTDAQSVNQIVTATATAAHIKAVKRHVVKHHVAKKHVVRRHAVKRHAR